MPGMEVYLDYQSSEYWDDYEYPLSDALYDDPDNNWHLNTSTPDDDYSEVPFVAPERSRVNRT